MYVCAGVFMCVCERERQQAVSRAQQPPISHSNIKGQMKHVDLSLASLNSNESKTDETISSSLTSVRKAEQGLKG